MKDKLALIAYYSGISYFLFFLSRLWYGRQHIRVVNYHSTPALYSENFERQISFYKKFYTNVTEKDLLEFFDKKSWKKEKPGLIISFDDGLKNNKEVALPILEKNGFTAWLCIPPDYIKEYQSLEGDLDSIIKVYGHELALRESISMSEEDILNASKKHEIVSHTANHRRLNAEIVDDEILNHEIIESKLQLEKIISDKINGFCWVGGELENYSEKAHSLISENYMYSLQTNNLPITRSTNRYFIDRSNVEVWFSFPLMLLTICGFYDLLYYRKRKLVKRALKGTNNLVKDVI